MRCCAQQNELKKTKETLFRLATNLRQLPERYSMSVSVVHFREWSVINPLPSPPPPPHLLLLLLPLSTAQLLEPFCRDHDIRVLGGDHQGGGVVVTSELEDPPGLYEKVSQCVCVCVCKPYTSIFFLYCFHSLSSSTPPISSSSCSTIISSIISSSCHFFLLLRWSTCYLSG